MQKPPTIAEMVEVGVPKVYAQALYSWFGEAYNKGIELDYLKLMALFTRAEQFAERA